MSAPLIILTLICFAVGLGISMVQARRRARARLADAVAREVERRLAAMAIERVAAKHGQHTD